MTRPTAKMRCSTGIVGDIAVRLIHAHRYDGWFRDGRPSALHAQFTGVTGLTNDLSPTALDERARRSPSERRGGVETNDEKDFRTFTPVFDGATRDDCGDTVPVTRFCAPWSHRPG